MTHKTIMNEIKERDDKIKKLEADNALLRESLFHARRQKKMERIYLIAAIKKAGGILELDDMLIEECDPPDIERNLVARKTILEVKQNESI